jgi:hypothetical protein
VLMTKMHAIADTYEVALEAGENFLFSPDQVGGLIVVLVHEHDEAPGLVSFRVKSVHVNNRGFLGTRVSDLEMSMSLAKELASVNDKLRLEKLKVAAFEMFFNEARKLLQEGADKFEYAYDSNNYLETYAPTWVETVQQFLTRVDAPEARHSHKKRTDSAMSIESASVSGNIMPRR